MSERRALLIGTSTYDDPVLPTLRATATETRQLWELLKDPEVGGFRAKYLVDERKQVVEREIEGLFADSGPNDHVLLYISGHGIKNAENQLFFATTDTVLQRPYSTAIPAVVVRYLLAECQARHKAVVLDCCYSGTFAAGPIAKSGNTVDVSTLGEGTYVITATNELDPAFEDSRVVFGNSTPYSLFTDVLIKGLDTSAAAPPNSDRITLDDLYEFLHQELSRPRQGMRVQIPHRLNHGQGAFVVAQARSRTLAVDELAPSPRLENLISRESPDSVRDLVVPIGQIHRSAARGTDVVRLDLAGRDGHLGIIGKVWSGKSTLLRTLIAGLRFGRSFDEISFALFDASAQLSDLSGTPHVRANVSPADPNAVTDCLDQVRELIRKRDQLFRSAPVGNMRRFRDLRAMGMLPPGDNADLFVVIDGWEEFADSVGSFAAHVRHIASAGLSKGVHLVVTARHWAELPEPISRLLVSKIELALDDPAESKFDSAVAAALPDQPGWGIHNGRPFLAAVAQTEDSADDLEALGEVLSKRADEAEAVEPDVAVPVQPSLLALLGIPGDPMTFDVRQAWRPRPIRDRYRVPFGVGEFGQPVELDIQEAAMEGMGPHGLCIGATGSGKSELLRTIVLGLMATHSSSELNFVLIDFKGGATFLGLDAAPHVAAVITNMAEDLTLVDRMKDALAGEMNRRQEVLRRGMFKNVWEYERARENGADLDPLPALFIVVDEFSELLSVKPDFIDLFVTIGRLGRSLQMHMLLASQRLEEGKLRGLDSHLSYRIGLKTFSATESRAVLGVPDAFELPSIPGTGYLKFDTSAMVRFKAAYVSGPVSDLVETEGRSDQAATTELDAIVSRLVGQGPPAHEVWLPPLAESWSLDRLLPPLWQSEDRGLSSTGGRPLQPVIGLVDKPFEQRRDPLRVDLTGGAGHVAIVGGAQSGKSTALRTLVLSMALTHTPEEAQFYCVDLGGGTLTTLAGLPHVGGVANRTEPDRVRRTIAVLSALLIEREQLFREESLDSVDAFRRRNRAGELRGPSRGDVFLVIDGWSVFRQEFEPLEQQVRNLAAQGLAYGLHVIITAQRWAEIRPMFRDQLGTRLELRLGDPIDSEIDRRTAMDVPLGRPGRVLTPDKLHFLVGLPRIDGSDDPGDLGAGVRDAVQRIDAAWRGIRAPQVRLLPDLLPYHKLRELDAGREGRAIPIGLDEDNLAPVHLDFDADPHFFALMDGESGKTSLLRTIVQGITERYTPKEAVVVLIDYRRTMLGFMETKHLLAYAVSANQLRGIVTEVTRSLQKRLPGPDVTQEQLKTRSWWKGPELFIVCDDYDLVCPPQNNPLQPLAELIPQAKDVGLHMVVARRTGGASRAMYDPVLGKLKELAVPALQGSGNREEGTLIGNVRPTALPPGRGVLVTRRFGPRVVQTAWLPPRDPVQDTEPVVTAEAALGPGAAGEQPS